MRQFAGQFRYVALQHGWTATDEINEFVAAIRDVVDRMHTSPSFWTEALGLAKRAVNI
jgi:hypothetical protein